MSPKLVKFADMLLAILLVLCLSSPVHAESDYYSLNETVYENLRKWAMENGAQVNKLTWPVVFANTGRGMAVNEDVNEWDEVVRVPIKLCIRKDTAKGTPIEDFVAEFHDYDGAMTVLMYEKFKGKDSFYNPFIEYLPKYYDMLDTWTDPQVIEFQDDDLFGAVIARRNDLRTQHKRFVRLVQDAGPRNAPVLYENLEQITPELYYWAWQTLGTRSFGFFDIPGRTKATLVPIADLMNHEDGASGSWTDTERDHIVIYAGRHFAAGAEMKISYGSESHFLSLHNYGFINPGSKLNSYSISIPNTASYYQDQVQVFGSDGRLLLHQYVEPFSLVRFMRTLAAGSLIQVENSIAPTSWTNEFRALEVFCPYTIDQYLNEKPTTLEDDEALLERLQAETPNKGDDQDFVRLKTAVHYRLDHKRILSKNKRFCATAVEYVLMCMPKRQVRSPIYYKKLRNIGNMMWHDVV